MLRAAREPLESRPRAPRTEAHPQNLIFRFLRDASSDMLTFGGAVGSLGSSRRPWGKKARRLHPKRERKSKHISRDIPQKLEK